MITQEQERRPDAGTPPATPPATPDDTHRAARVRALTGHSRVRIATLLAVNLVGLVAFLWPFVLPVAPGVNENHADDGPLILAVLVLSLGCVLFAELGRGGIGPKTVALLGVLGAAMVALRLPGFVAGFSAMFIVVLVAGNSFGPGFGFLLGAVGTFASGLFLGGVGPWLPFQMVAVGWVGMGAGLLPKSSWGVRIGSLAVYGAIAGYLFGAVMNLWSWPFLTTGTAVDWDPTADAAENLRHYLAFYAASSFAWDTFRAVGNAALVVVLGRPLLGALDRAARRMRLEVSR
jgi:energy-coupling factor transport system substrate-specific component